MVFLVKNAGFCFESIHTPWPQPALALAHAEAMVSVGTWSLAATGSQLVVVN